MKELEGKTIHKLWVNHGESLLIFETDQGDIAYRTAASCCSETWFADVIGVKDLLGHRVNSTEEIEMDGIDDGRTRQKSDQFYGIQITTDRGIVDVVFRNSSNGYYGGEIIYEPKIRRPKNLREITADWQA